MADLERVDRNVSSSHYDVGGLPMSKIWKAKLTREEFIGFCKGNILKYIIRANYKNGLQDYQKAAQYFEWLLEAAQEEDKHD